MTLLCGLHCQEAGQMLEKHGKVSCTEILLHAYRVVRKDGAAIQQAEATKCSKAVNTSMAIPAKTCILSTSSKVFVSYTPTFGLQSGVI